MLLILFILIFLISTAIYYYFHKKTGMNKKFFYIDNLLVILLSFTVSMLAYRFVLYHLKNDFRFTIALIIGSVFIVIFLIILTMIRFWGTPKRKITAKENEIVSPADGNVIYIKKIEKGETPISVKKGELNRLNELTKTDLLNTTCWLIGINMTPWDVHKNCTPIDGKVILNKYTKGQFFSLKKFESETMNERNTFVIENDQLKIGVVLIASKRVRRIDSYVEENRSVKKGDWIGMIRFGSQVDVILPISCEIKIKLGEQIYAAKTIIASL